MGFLSPFLFLLHLFSLPFLEIYPCSQLKAHFYNSSLDVSDDSGFQFALTSNFPRYQLIWDGIDLAHKIFCIRESTPLEGDSSGF